MRPDLEEGASGGNNDDINSGNDGDLSHDQDREYLSRNFR
jgi:hypothetical protein